MKKIKGILYRIMTEKKNLDQVLKLTDSYFSSYSHDSKRGGRWRGTNEASLLIEIITDKESKVKKLAGDIKKLNNQDAVLVEVISNNAFLI